MSKSAAIRSEFDKILMDHISSLIDTREDIAALPFNLATIASLLLLAERENEIKSFPESPPERYNRETFFSDIEEIGLELDDDLIQAIQNLELYGFVVINADTRYIARESASLLILVLDSIFPQMPGLNLVAYVSQAIEEVTSGRKERKKALQQFDQTLDKQGVRLSAIPESQLGASVTQRILPHEAPDPEILKERRSAYLQKLKALRAKSLSSDASPTVVFGGTSLKHVKIKELFPKNAPSPEPPAVFSEPPPEEATPAQDMDIAPLSDVQTPEPTEASLLQAEPQPTDIFTDTATEMVGKEAIEPADVGEEPAQPYPEDEISEPISDVVTGMDQEATIASDLQEQESKPASVLEEPLSKEELIEQRIRQFEEELAMPCPICGLGKVLSDTTEKGKVYYHCSNEDCRLISWGKPYPMDCPVCKNPFLIEVQAPDGQVGLKCPRATCMYRKKAANGVLSGDEGLEKKKVAVVKKKVRKGVRRVVRRKK